MSITELVCSFSNTAHHYCFTVSVRLGCKLVGECKQRQRDDGILAEAYFCANSYARNVKANF